MRGTLHRNEILTRWNKYTNEQWYSIQWKVNSFWNLKVKKRYFTPSAINGTKIYKGWINRKKRGKINIELVKICVIAFTHFWTRPDRKIYHLCEKWVELTGYYSEKHPSEKSV